MIETVELRNFKIHRHTQLNLDSSRLHALVGQNSAGKTSILQALYYLSQVSASARFAESFTHQQSPEFIATIGQNDVFVSGCGVWNNQNTQEPWEASYGFRRKEVDSWSSPIISYRVGERSYSSEKQGHRVRLFPHPEISKALGHAVSLKLVAVNLARAAYSDAITPKIQSDGSDLAPTLDYLRNEVPERFKLLQEMLKQIVPGVQKVGIRRAKVMLERQRLIEVDGKSISYEELQEVSGQEVVLDMNTGARIPAHAISEGTMLALGLLTVLMSPNPPNLILLDDVEQGLHPKAQRELITVFKQIIQANQNIQIIFSTHSPYIVDELTPSQVHVLSNTHSGFTSSKRLDEHPDVEWAKQTLTTGEFWDAEGEDWVNAGEINA